MRGRGVVVTVCFAWLTIVGKVGAQKTCVPLAIGVPGGLYQQAPNWWNNSSPPRPYMSRFDDPRWQGAVSHTDGQGAEHVDFRAVHRNDTLFLSWVVRVDPSIDVDVSDILTMQDALWVGIEQKSRPPLIFKFVMKSSTYAEAYLHANSGGYLVAVWETDMSGPDYVRLLPSPTAPRYVSGGTVPNWITSTTAVWRNVHPIDGWWAVQMALPTVPPGASTNLDDGPSIDATFRMWYQLDVKLPANTNPVNYTWPRIPIPIPTPPPPTMTFDGYGGPLISEWQTFTRVEPLPNDCGADVTIEAHTDIGTEGTPYSSEIRYSLTTPVANALFVRPKNVTSAPARDIPQDSVYARMWLANWGSQPSWDPASGQWTEITAGPPSALPKNRGLIAPGRVAESSNQIQYDWTITDACWLAQLERGRLLEIGGDPSTVPLPTGCPDTPRGVHQCVLVELSSPHAYTFARKSLWRNMDMVKTSSPFVRNAQVSVGNLPAAERPGPKTVYLYVQAQNLPRTTTGDATRGQDFALAKLAAAQPQRVAPAPAPQPRDTSRPRALVPDSAVDTRARIGFFYSGNDGLDSLLPTYRVHVYRETGDSIEAGGRKYATITPQTSFGYWVRHSGDVAGWRYELLGDGVTLQELAPNFYKVVVPNDSFVTVRSVITPITPRRLAVSVHGGASVPQGSFANTVDVGYGVTGDLEFRVSSAISLEGLAGFHTFPGITSGDTDLRHFSGGVKLYGWRPRTRLLLTAGAGAYYLNSSAAVAGAHGGAGLQFSLSPYSDVEFRATMHTSESSGAKTTFISLQVGAQLRL